MSGDLNARAKALDNRIWALLVKNGPFWPASKTVPAIEAALSAAYARGRIKGLVEAREIAGTMAERPYDSEPEFSAVLHVEDAIDARLATLFAGPDAPPPSPAKVR